MQRFTGGDLVSKQGVIAECQTIINNDHNDHGRDDHHNNHHNHHDKRHHHDDDNLPLTYLNATVDVTATDGNGHVLTGSGNPASGWEIQTLGAFQLATDVHYRHRRYRFSRPRSITTAR